MFSPLSRLKPRQPGKWNKDLAQHGSIKESHVQEEHASPSMAGSRSDDLPLRLGTADLSAEAVCPPRSKRVLVAIFLLSPAKGEKSINDFTECNSLWLGWSSWYLNNF